MRARAARKGQQTVEQTVGRARRRASQQVAQQVGRGEGLLGRALHDVATGRFERTLAGLTAFGAVVTTMEIYTSHDSASFGKKLMWVPIAVVPTLVPAGVAAVVSRRAARTVLPVASALVIANGLQGTFLHARGIAQKPGGWKLAAYNLEMGPPLFAPALASLVGGMGLLASVLRREGSADDGPALASTPASRLGARTRRASSRVRALAA